ncbi:uncharacterized protein MELLADRAFT_73102 [Melampsora larici-populina 98AG31]|uniref:Uncharacterized protein n=1 Tax=Melampsora larici-populina (strain 98AG31 / pathotype 3-4-7) TaxID=747676 RepID=F4S348_MELLP|nr:uncharacterized protein MELLADRAFT_73102 [Melampsora larici-populina 98AG31]EGG00972.1 hypothetical protein MELLADRAFT_73102 [Melampsora larici-populina 98AG31]
MISNEEPTETDYDLIPSTSKPTSKPSINSQFSLQNGKVFQTIFENASDYGLSKSDQELLLEGRQLMITYTRLGFIIGAMISPLPFFWKSKALIKSFPPLVSNQTHQPDLKAIKARVWWITQSVGFTTLGSALGSWIGFYFGLKGLNRRIDRADGVRNRFEKALEDASGRIADGNVNAKRSGSGRDENENQDQDRFENPSNLDSNSTSTSNPTSIITTSTKSRWEELRNEKLTKPSRWEEIRGTQSKSNPIPELNKPFPTTTTTTTTTRNRNQDEMDTNTKEIQRIEFEELLEKERRVCSIEDESLKNSKVS